MNFPTKFINNQTIITGDCLEVMKYMDGMQFKACITDPPYNISFDKEAIQNTIRTSSKNAVITANWDKWETLDDFKIFTLEWLKQLKRILLPKANIFMFFSYIHREWIIQTIKTAGYNYRKPLIWYKPDTMAIFPNCFGANYEDIHWFTNKQDSVNIKYYLKIPPNMRDVFTYNSTTNAYRKESNFHPTVKPIRLIMDLISICTKEEDTIIDPFAGSGTTLKACILLNRKGTGIEINPEYVKSTETRLANTPQRLSLWNKPPESPKNNTPITKNKSGNIPNQTYFKVQACIP